MWPERWLVLLLSCLLVAGCATTTSSSRLPAESSADQARHAAQIHTELGQHYLQRGKLEVALGKLKKALQFDPNYMPAHTVIAVLYERIGKLQLAEKHYRKAQALDPTKGSVNNNLGQFLCKVGRIDEAMGYFSKAVADPFYKTPLAAYVNAGTCLVKAGRPAEAEVQLDKALRLSPADPEALFQMASALVAQDDFFHARAFIQRFDALGHPRPEALLLGYTIEARLGELKAARQYAEQLRAQFPDSPQARSLRDRKVP